MTQLRQLDTLSSKGARPQNRTKKSARLCASLLVVGALLGGCSSTGLDFEEPKNIGDDGPRGPLGPNDKPVERVGGGSLLSFGGGKDSGPQLPVNRYLWRATLDTISFLPLASTDPHGGVIISDWGSTPEAPRNRFKVTVYITSAQLSPTSLRVAVTRQVRNRQGTWVAAATDSNTERQLENAILTRARVLRSGEKRD